MASPQHYVNCVVSTSLRQYIKIQSIILIFTAIFLQTLLWMTTSNRPVKSTIYISHKSPRATPDIYISARVHTLQEVPNFINTEPSAHVKIHTPHLPNEQLTSYSFHQPASVQVATWLEIKQLLWRLLYTHIVI